MVDLTADKRKGMPQSQFGLPGKRFPMNDATHQRLAIGGATRAEHAGNISGSTADKIKAEARHKLGINPQKAGPPAQHLPRTHALTMAAATHLHNQGHLPTPQAARIHANARANINLLKQGKPPMPAQPQPFGSLAPTLGGPENPQS